jgi:co-chaperonin GroES (HSP10)
MQTKQKKFSILPKGAKVFVKFVEKENKEDQTKSGFILTSKDKDSHDNALLMGEVVEVGTKEIDINGREREPDVEIGSMVYFNRYNAFKTHSEGTDDFFLVACVDIWGVVQE